MQWQDIFIDAQSLRQVLENPVSPTPRIFDCRFQLAIGGEPAKGIEFYHSEHLPNADYLDLEQQLSGPVLLKSGRHPWPGKEQILSLAKQHQLTFDTPIVFYDNGKLAFAGRAWLLFQLAGFHRSRLLLGGIAAYQKEVSSPGPKSHASSNDLDKLFTPVQIPVELYTLPDLNGQLLIDAREDFRFRGEKEPIDPIAGTIPTAKNFPWLDNFDASGSFHRENWHRNRWQSLGSSQPPVHFCGSGVTAIVNIISALIGTNQPQRLYPGGWSEYLHYIKK